MVKVTDFNLGLKALVRALGFLPSYQLSDSVKSYNECYYIREQSLTIYFSCNRGVDKIHIRHTGRNRVDEFTLVDNHKLTIWQLQGKVVTEGELYNRLLKCAGRVHTTRSMRQIASDHDHYYNSNLGKTQ